MADGAARPFQARSLARGASLMFLAQLGTMAFGLLQVVLLAKIFGATSMTDAFFTGQSISFLLVGAVEAGLSMAFVPSFVHKYEHEGRDAAWMLAAGLFRAGLWVVVLFSLAISALAGWLPHLVAPGFNAETSASTAGMIRMLAPVTVLIYAGAFLTTLDIIRERYLLPALAPLLYAAAGPIALYLYADRFGIGALIAGLYLGALLRCLVLLVAFPDTARLFGKALSWRDPDMRSLGRTLGLRLLISWFMELNLVIDRIFASLLGEGFVSCLAYASRAVVTAVRIILRPASRVLMPAFSRLAAHRDHDRMQRLLEQVGIAIGFMVIPLVMFLAGFRHDLLTVLFKRGQFAGQSVDLTATALLYYSVGVIAFIITPLLNGAFFSLRNSAVPFRIGALMVVLNAECDVILMRFLGHGGIALATSVVAGVQAVLLWRSLGREFGRLQVGNVLVSLLRSLASAGLALLAARGLALLARHAGMLGRAPVRLTVMLLAGSVVYLLLQSLWNREAMGRFLELARRRRAAAEA